MRTAFTAVLAAISLAAISFPASAEPIDHAVAGNPEAIMAQVGAMHLTPLSDQDAAQVRGAAWMIPGWMYAIVSKFLSAGHLVSSFGASYLNQMAAEYGWKINGIPVRFSLMDAIFVAPPAR